MFNYDEVEFVRAAIAERKIGFQIEMERSGKSSRIIRYVSAEKYSPLYRCMYTVFPYCTQNSMTLQMILYSHRITLLQIEKCISIIEKFNTSVLSFFDWECKCI